MKTKTKRTTTTRPWIKVQAINPANSSPIMRQAILEVLVNGVTKKLNAVDAWVRVEYQNDRARVFGSNGQKVLCSLV